MAQPPLPSYKEYRKNFITEGVKFPLNIIEQPLDGLLGQLPKSEKYGWPWNIQVDPNSYTGDKNWPKITVVSPSYNQAQFLEETLRSVLLQNYPNLEYIVMDAQSPDESVGILKSYSKWLSYWESKKDRGQSHAINKGFSLASGEIFCWLNSDDIFTQGALQKVAITFLKKNTQFVYGDSWNQKGDELSPFMTSIIMDRYLPLPGLPQPSVFWKKEIHRPLWEELNCTLDFELWMRLAYGVRKKYINEFLSIAKVHPDAKTYNEDPKVKALWQQDHDKQWAVHGPYNYNRLEKENKYFQFLLRKIPILKRFF